MKVFITGSTDGLGKLAARDLLADGHEVLLHARNQKRADEIMQQLPDAVDVVVADLSNIQETIAMANKVNAFGSFDSIIHNAGVYRDERPLIFRVNVLAPYILTCLIQKPKRLIYMNSGLHQGGRFFTKDLAKGISYSDSKLLLLVLAKAVARKWPDVYVNSVNPGWVPTKMGGSGAPDDLQEGVNTQVWLAASNQALVTGKYFYHMQESTYNQLADDVTKQEELLSALAKISGIEFPV